MVNGEWKSSSRKQREKRLLSFLLLLTPTGIPSSSLTWFMSMTQLKNVNIESRREGLVKYFEPLKRVRGTWWRTDNWSS